MVSTKEEILKAACKLGRCIQENGGEIYRVEQSIGYFMRAYGIENAEIFAIPATIIVTITDDDGKPITKVERVKSISQNMYRLDKANDLSRWICDNKPEMSVIYEKLDEIKKGPKMTQNQLMIAFGIASGFFAYFWGGDTGDAITAFLVGVATQRCWRFVTKYQSNVFFSNLISSIVIGACSVIGIELNIGHDIDMIISGAIMTLVPGISITNVMRDIISGDIITGATKIVEVLLIALAIAIGVAMPLSLYTALGGII